MVAGVVSEKSFLASSFSGLSLILPPLLAVPLSATPSVATGVALVSRLDKQVRSVIP